MKVLKIHLVVAAALLLASAPVRADEESGSSGGGIATREGLVFHVDAMADFMRALGTNADPAIRFMGQLTAQNFFTNRFGLGLSGAIVTRSFQSGSRASSASFVDVTFGIVGRRNGDFFSDSSTTFYEIGPFLAIPLGDFTGPVTLPFSNSAKPFYGLSIVSGTVYPITESFGIGPAFTFRMAFANAVKASSDSVWFWDVCVGLRASF